MNREKMGSKRIPSLLLEFSLPATAGMLINALYNIIDRIFIGNSPDIGSHGLAGLTVTFPIIIIIMAVALMCGVGGATLFSISLGERKPEEAKHIAGNAFSLAAITAIIVCVLNYIFMDSVLLSFGASSETLPYAREYMEIILLGGVFQAINMAGNNLIRADGSPSIAMLSILLGGIIHMILDPIFIYGFHWGMKGAAIATIIGQFTSTLWILHYYTKGKANYKLKRIHLRLNKDIAFKVMITGLPSFFIQTAASVLNIVLNTALLKYGGDLAISAMGIVNSFQTLLMLPMIGINQGALPIIGYNYGAKKYERIKETIKYAAVINTILAVVGFSLTQLFSQEIITLFNKTPELVDMGSKILRAWFLCLPIVGINLVFSNYFQAIGKVKPAIFLTLSRQILILIPLILILSSKYGFDGLIYAQPISDIASSILVFTFFFISINKLSKQFK
ncbi:MAG: MATE family efflux transporter [Erysipelotrichales bacterium]